MEMSGASLRRKSLHGAGHLAVPALVERPQLGRDQLGQLERPHLRPGGLGNGLRHFGLALGRFITVGVAAIHHDAGAQPGRFERDAGGLHARRQVGSGLIEILIAMLIALFLMAGVVVVFVNLKNAFTSQDQLAQLQDNERLALTILTNTVQAAGYYPDPVGSTALLSLPASTNAVYGSLAAGQPISIPGSMSPRTMTADRKSTRLNSSHT